MSGGYLEWATDTLGVTVHTSISLQATGEEERGMVCAEDVPANSMVLSVPFASLLTLESLPGSPLGALLPAGMREDDQLALLLLHEIHVQGEASRWSKHLQLLPVTYHSLPCMTEDEMLLLEGTALHVIGQSWQQQLRRDFDEITSLRLADGSNLGNTFGWLNFDRYRWALCTIFSRFVTVARGGRQYKAMGPVFDMFNHDPSSTTMHGFQEPTDCLHIFTPQSWQAGQELCINYGPMSNTHLTMFYGFAIPSNPYNHVDLWATMSPQTPSYAMKNALLATHAVLHAQHPFKIYADKTPTDVIQALRVQHADLAEESRMRLAFRGLPLSRRNEDEILSILEAALTQMLAGITGTHRDDLALLQQWGFANADGQIVGAPSPEQRTQRLVFYRQGQRNILQKAIESVSDYRTLAMPRATLSQALMDDRVALILLMLDVSKNSDLLRDCLRKIQQQGFEVNLLEPVTLESLPEDLVEWQASTTATIFALAFSGEDATTCSASIVAETRDLAEECGASLINVEAYDEIAHILGNNFSRIAFPIDTSSSAMFA